MIRKGSKMKVYPHAFEEYKKRHDELWPEMADMLRAHGAKDYSIFLDEETGTLFAYVTIASEKRWSEVAETAICQKWWQYMKDIMETNEDGSPVSQELKEVFYLS